MLHFVIQVRLWNFKRGLQKLAGLIDLFKKNDLSKISPFFNFLRKKNKSNKAADILSLEEDFPTFYILVYSYVQRKRDCIDVDIISRNLLTA